MWKKSLPLIGLSCILLVGCNNTGDTPNNNETPMQDVHEGTNNENGTSNNQNDNNINENTNSQVEIIEDLNRKNDVEE